MSDDILSNILYDEDDDFLPPEEAAPAVKTAEQESSEEEGAAPASPVRSKPVVHSRAEPRRSPSTQEDDRRKRSSYDDRQSREESKKPKPEEGQITSRIRTEQPAERSSNQATRYFIIRCTSQVHLDISQRHSAWATMPKNERAFIGAYKGDSGEYPIIEQCVQLKVSGRFLASRNSNVIFFFSVNESRNFQGYAQMMSLPGECSVSRSIWTEKGMNTPTGLGLNFSVKWQQSCELSFDEVQHLKNPLNDNKPVGRSRDGQELPDDIGKKLVQLFEQKALQPKGPVENVPKTSTNGSSTNGSTTSMSTLPETKRLVITITNPHAKDPSPPIATSSSTSRLLITSISPDTRAVALSSSMESLGRGAGRRSPPRQETGHRGYDRYVPPPPPAPAATRYVPSTDRYTPAMDRRPPAANRHPPPLADRYVPSSTNSYVPLADRYAPAYPQADRYVPSPVSSHSRHPEPSHPSRSDRYVPPPPPEEQYRRDWRVPEHYDRRGEYDARRWPAEAPPRAPEPSSRSAPPDRHRGSFDRYEPPAHSLYSHAVSSRDNKGDYWTPKQPPPRR